MTAIAATSYTTIALLNDSTVIAWGYNADGELGNGTLTGSCQIHTNPCDAPVTVSGLSGVVAIAAGGSHVLALKSDGTLWAWGDNSYGQLGDTTTTRRTSPVQVTSLGASVVAIGANNNSSHAVLADGTLWSWGFNQYGEAGDGTTTTRSTPVQTSGLTAMAHAGGGSHTSFGINQSGVLKAWGYGADGELGNGTWTGNVTTPVTTTGMSTTAAIAGGGFHGVAAKTDGTTWAWGYNNFGQIGDGTTTSRNAPVQVAGLDSVVAVAGGPYFSAAVASDGRVWAWGDNRSGQLGDGTVDTRLAPVPLRSSGGAWATATPRFSPGGGGSQAAVTVTLTSVTPYAVIYYTLDGTDPIPFFSPVINSGQTVTISQTATLKALAYAQDHPYSGIETAVYTLTVPAPTFSPGAGTYTSAQTVSIADSVSGGATIYYTTDGSTPTTSSPIYTGAFSVSTGTTVKAIAIKSGWTTSSVNSATYTLNYGTLAAPTFSPAPGTYTATQSVTLSAASGATIRYTLDGSTPTASSAIYSSPLAVNTTTTIYAKAFKTDWTTSAQGGGAYTLKVPTPGLSLAAGTYVTGTTVTVTDANASATLRYTTNGVDPATTDPTIANGGTITLGNSTVKVRAFLTGWTSSDVASGAYTIKPVTPTITPGGGAYTSAQTVTLASSPSDATVVYTTDGSTPTTASPSYGSPLTISTGTTLKTMAWKTGWTNSDVTSATYTFNYGTLGAPSSSPAPGIFAANQTVTLSGPSGATIYYTTDGSTPTTASPVYATALTLTQTATVKALAVKTDWTSSAVMTATYQIDSAGPTVTTHTLPAPTAAGWNRGPVTVSFTCTDALAGVQSCPSPVAFDQEGANQQVTVHATDLVGNDTSTTVTVNIDKTAPVVTLSAPANPSTTTNSSVGVTASISDALSGATTATCNGAAATIASGSIGCTVNLRPGVNIVIVQASDAAGNSASASAAVTRSAVATALTVVPATRGMTVGDTVTLYVLEDSGLAAPTAMWATSDGSIATVASDGTVTAVGAGTATITATDGGLSAQAAVTVSASALAVGATRWAVDPLPAVSTSQVVGMSGLDGTSLATIETVTDSAAIIRGLTTDGEPTWTVSVPLAADEQVNRVMGDVFGGVVVLTNGVGVVRLDPAGSASWRFNSPDGVNDWAQAPDGTIFLNSYTALTALDGTTGSVKFRIDAPPSTLGCTGGDPFVPEQLGFWGLKVDASGRANIVAPTRWWDYCYSAPPTVLAKIDVTLYRIDASGTVTIVPVSHREYTYNDLTSPHGWNPNPIANTMPGDDGGVQVWWSPSYNDYPELARAAYVTDANSVGADYALGRAPALSTSGQIGYVNLPATLNWSDAAIVYIEKINMLTGAVLWTVSSNGGAASVATGDDRLIVGNVPVSTGYSQMTLATDGSVAASPGPMIAKPLILSGDTQVGESTGLNSVVAVSSETSYASNNGFAMENGDEEQRVTVRNPRFVYFCQPLNLYGAAEYTCIDYERDVKLEVSNGALKISPTFYTFNAAKLQTFLNEIKNTRYDVFAFVGHAVTFGAPYFDPRQSVGVQLDDKSWVKDPFIDAEPNRISQSATPVTPGAKIVILASCDIGPEFKSLLGIDDGTSGRALIVGPTDGVNLYWGAGAVDKIATALANGKNAAQAVGIANTWLQSQSRSLRFQVVGDGNVKAR